PDLAVANAGTNSVSVLLANLTYLNGWVVQLQDPTNGNAVIATTTTDGFGNYTFAFPHVGSYRVREVIPAGWTQTTANPSDFNVAEGTTTTGVDFGNFQGEITGSVFQDNNGDGARGPNDSGFVGRTVYIDANNNGSLDSGEVTTTTDVNGNYLFVV